MTASGALTPRTNGAALVSVEPLDHWQTPTLWQVLLATLLGLSLVLALVSGSLLHSLGGRVHQFGYEAAPSIILAQQIGAALADFDANVVNTMMGTDAQQSKARAQVEAKRAELSKLLVLAAENITFGDSEREPIMTLQQGLSTYYEQEARARQLFELKQLPDAIATYRVATEQLHSQLLTAANQLDAANRAYMDGSYQQGTRSLTIDSSALSLLSLLLLVTLGVVQFKLWKRTRRIFNPGLLLASLLAFGMFRFLGSSLDDASHELKVAKMDAFDSIDALYRMRMIAFDANGDESRYLFDSDQRFLAEQAFEKQIRLISTTPDIALREERKLWTSPPVFEGLLANELRNITFPGEREAALSVTSTFFDYIRVDRKIRSLERAGKHEDAIALCTGYGPQESNGLFSKLDEAILSTIDINRVAFDSASHQALQKLERAEWMAPTACGLIAALCVLGFWPRLREYS